jgi:hypothetical protein
VQLGLLQRILHPRHSRILAQQLQPDGDCHSGKPLPLPA